MLETVFSLTKTNMYTVGVKHLQLKITKLMHINVLCMIVTKKLKLSINFNLKLSAHVYNIY